MKSCNTCKHNEISIRYLPCRMCTDYCLWDMPTSYKEIFAEELEKIREEAQERMVFRANPNNDNRLEFSIDNMSLSDIIDNHIPGLKGENKR